MQWAWFPDAMKKVFLTAFSKMKQTVLWKYDQEDMENIPRNVIIKKWFPQSSILSIRSYIPWCSFILNVSISEHKNVKLFITHCGALSIQEAIYHGVPMLGIPFFGDQKNNVVKIENKMIGKRLKLAEITEDALTKSILEVLDNPM